MAIIEEEKISRKEKNITVLILSIGFWQQAIPCDVVSELLHKKLNLRHLVLLNPRARR